VTLAVVLAGLLASVALASPAQAATARPEPPTTAELRARTPAPARGASALTHLGTPSRLPSGGTQVFPDHRVISLYGAPQMHATILGRLSPSEAGQRVRAETLRYRFEGSKPRVRAFELVAAIATADSGRDGLYRFRQSQATIATYLKAARAARARLILDIQPGRSPFTEEVRALERWLREPDVDVALDPEWNVGRRGVPGRTDGSVDAATVNAVSRQLAEIVRDRRLPQKMLIVHQFRRESIRGESDILPRRRVATTLSFDGIGSPSAKASGYRALSSSHLFNGFCLFYRLDNPLMSPSSVLRLRPRPDYVMYQ
jgi:hypothetical protein